MFNLRGSLLTKSGWTKPDLVGNNAVLFQIYMKTSLFIFSILRLL